MTVKCLISCTNELIGVSVENLCKTQADLEVVNAQSLNEANMAQLIERFQPDVLITDRVDGSVEMNNLTKMLQPLVNLSDIRIIVLDEKVNVLHVLERKDVLINEVSDLLSILRNTANGN